MNKRPDQGDRDRPPAGSSLDDRTRRLDEALDRKRTMRVRAATRRSDSPGFGNAMRLSTEFVSAILVGAALGWGIDKLAGTAPWGMIVLLMLGFCAGVLNVMRAAGRISDPHKKPTDAGGVDENNGESGR